MIIFILNILKKLFFNVSMCWIYKFQKINYTLNVLITFVNISFTRTIVKFWLKTNCVAAEWDGNCLFKEKNVGPRYTIWIYNSV